MDFSANKQDTYEKRIASLPDQPNMQPDELKAYFDSSPEQLRQAHNGLCDALTEATSGTSAASGLGFQRTAGVPADNVQAAVENVQAQLDAAVMGNIPSGSVTQDKLAQDVRDRFAAIESAAASEASTRASVDSNLQNQINTHTGQIAILQTTKAEIACGYYEGDEAATRFISLGRTPKAVLLLSQAWGLSYRLSEYCYGGLAVTGSPVYYWNQNNALVIVENGFEVYYQIGKNLATNALGRYHYIAVF